MDFLLIDDRSPDRILGFSTTEGVEILCRASTIDMDGTFKVVPAIFSQLYTLHTFYKGKMMPLAYFLLPDKSTATYRRMFRLLEDYAATRNLPVFRPAKLQLDFETAALKAIAEVFPTAEVKGCMFHFTQAVWKKVQRLGLQTYYKSDVNVRRYAITSLIRKQCMRAANRS